MNILSLLGINILTKPVSGLAKQTHEEYYSRYSRIKYVVEAIPEIKENINHVFCKEYLGNKLPEHILLLGQGRTHNIYNIYPGSIKDNGCDVSLALRVKKLTDDCRFYKIKSDYDMANFQLFSELNTFCDAFVKGGNPPYFTGLVEWRGPDEFEEGVVGLITEDVTKRKRLKSSIKNDTFTDYLAVTDENGLVNDFFVGIVAPHGYNKRILKYATNPIKVDYSPNLAVA